MNIIIDLFSVICFIRFLIQRAPPASLLAVIGASKVYALYACASDILVRMYCIPI